MELKDTVEMMLSSDYKERFKAEYYQLKIRYDNLSSIIKRYHAGTLEFDLESSIELLEGQRKAMYAYLCYVEARAVAEDLGIVYPCVEHLIEYEGFNRNISRILAASGIDTLEALQGKTISDLRAIKGIAGGSIMQIRNILKKNGLCLKDDEAYLNGSSFSQEENR